jgi:hypothetical protein
MSPLAEIGLTCTYLHVEKSKNGKELVAMGMVPRLPFHIQLVLQTIAKTLER